MPTPSTEDLLVLQARHNEALERIRFLEERTVALNVEVRVRDAKIAALTSDESETTPGDSA